MYRNWTAKPAHLRTHEDIETLAHSEEGTYLEFKKATEFLANGRFARDKLIEELVETASAFLNADGGVILLGAQTFPATDDRKVEYLKPSADWVEAQTLEHWGITDPCIAI